MLTSLHFTNAWHANSGGIGTFYRALLAEAEREGWQAKLVVPGAETRYEAWGRCTGVHYVRAPRAPFSPEYRILYPHTYLLPGSPIRRILRQERPGIVEVCDKYTLLYLAGLLRVNGIRAAGDPPVVVGLSCERMDENVAAYAAAGSTAMRLVRAYMKCLYFPQFDHHIAVSRHAASELEIASRGHKVTRGVWIRGMGVDTVRFTPERKSEEKRRAIAARYGVNAEATLLLYAGRLAPEKNLGLLLNTMDRLDADRFQLLIAGDGPLRYEFLAEAETRFPGGVVYLGHVGDREHLADLFANVDAFLHPNPAEPFGIAPLEAMAAGAPLVAPDTGGVTAYANVGNAWVTRPTGECFAAAVKHITGDAAAHLERTRRARSTAEHLNWPSTCRGFLDLYRSLHDRHRKRSTTPQMEPAFYSTPGNWLGLEISDVTQQAERS